MTAIERAYESLEGLSVGDAFGEQFFIGEYDALELVLHRRLPEPMWHFTDDTNMALSIVECLREFEEIDQSFLAESFSEHYSPFRGYGAAMHSLLPRISDGQAWRILSKQLFHGSGSFGNGAAMRSAPIGAYFAGDRGEVIEQARRASEITHAHLEGIAGGIAVAVAASIAAEWRESGQEPDSQALLSQVADVLPGEEVASGIRRALGHPADMSPIHAAVVLGNGVNITAQDTVPFCLWSAATCLDDYEEAIWRTVSVLGDIDTNCAIVGGIVAAFVGFEGLPAEWRTRRELLPDWFNG